jgi:hypothetical protein
MSISSELIFQSLQIIGTGCVRPFGIHSCDSPSIVLLPLAQYFHWLHQKKLSYWSERNSTNYWYCSEQWATWLAEWLHVRQSRGTIMGLILMDIMGSGAFGLVGVLQGGVQVSFKLSSIVCHPMGTRGQSKIHAPQFILMHIPWTSIIFTTMTLA